MAGSLPSHAAHNSILMRPAVGITLVTIVGLCSCTPIRTEVAQSPLSPPRMSADSVALDLYFVRLSSDQVELEDQLWSELDEQHLPADVRRRLAKDGFRVGLVAGQTPTPLAELMELKGSADADTTEEDGTQKMEFDRDYRVRSGHMKLRTGKPGEIVALNAKNEVIVLRCQDGGVSGDVFKDAQGIFTAKTFPQADGRVRVELVPELRHGRIKQQFVPSPGMLRIEAKREAEVYDSLAFDATLTAGDMLVIGGLDNCSGSLGHHFFTSTSGTRRERELLVIRLVQTQHDPLFSAGEILPLGDLK